MEFIRDYWSQIIVLLGAIVAAVKMNSLLQILRRDVDSLDKDIKRRDTYVETVKLRAEVDQLNKNVSSLWEQKSLDWFLALVFDNKRDKTTICVVEDIRVMMAIETTMLYKGIYHILGGLISPIDGINPNDIRIEELINRIENQNVIEIIFALSTTMEGDTTNYYLFRRLKNYNIKISSIARGIAIGDELEYTDEITLGAAISSRTPYSE